MTCDATGWTGIDSGITICVRQIGTRLVQHLGLYDSLDPLIEFGYQRWPFGRAESASPRRADHDLRTQRPTAQVDVDRRVGVAASARSADGL